jgi:hypothetical protein
MGTLYSPETWVHSCYTAEHCDNRESRNVERYHKHPEEWNIKTCCLWSVLGPRSKNESKGASIVTKARSNFTKTAMFLSDEQRGI